MRPARSVFVLLALGGLGACALGARPPLDAQPSPARAPGTLASGDDTELLGQEARGCRWVRARAVSVFTEHDSRREVFVRTLLQARSQAVSAALGVDVTQRFVDLEQQSAWGATVLLEGYLRTVQRGYLREERILDARPEDLPGCPGCRFVVRIEACVAPRPRGASELQVAAAMTRTRLHAEEEVRLRVRASAASYLYLLSVDTDWKAQLLFPQSDTEELFVRAGEELELPGAGLRAHGWRLKARLPPGEDLAVETLRVIAAREVLPRAVLRPAASPDGTIAYLELLQRLHALDIEWAEDVLVYTIARPTSPHAP